MRKQDPRDMEQLTEIDVLSTNDQTLVELAHHIVDRLEGRHLKVIDLSEITSEHRYIRIKMLYMSEKS
jgi:hypothetical protein